MTFREWNHQRVNQIVGPVGTALGTNQQLFLTLLDSLLPIQGCTMVGSSDSITAGMDGLDRLTTASKFIWGNAGSPHSWFVLQFQFQGNAQILLSLEGASANGQLVVAMFSPGGLFTGGTNIARPTATDEVSFVSTNTVAFSTDGSYVVHAPYTTDGSQFSVAVYRTGVTGAVWTWHQGLLRDAPAALLTPWFAGWSVNTSGNAGGWTAWAETANAHWKFGAVNATAYLSAQTFDTATALPSKAIWPSSISGLTQMFPVGFASKTANAKGVHGRIADIYYTDATAAGHIAITPDGARFFVVDAIAIPWDSTTPFISTSIPTEVDVQCEIIGMPAGGGGLRSFTTPGTLNTDPTEARWTPIVLTFDVPPLYDLTIIAQIGLDSALWMVAYEDALNDGHNGGLAPLFEDKSTIVSTGTQAGGRHFTVSILPNGGWQRPDIKLIPKFSREIV